MEDSTPVEGSSPSGPLDASDGQATDRRTEDDSARRGAAWARSEYEQLIEEIRSGVAASDIAKAHQRPLGGITSACRRLLPPDQRKISSDSAPAVLALYLHENPSEVLENPYIKRRAHRRQRAAPDATASQSVSPATPSDSTERSEQSEQLDIADRSPEWEPGDASALSGEAVASLEKKLREQRILRLRLGIGDEPHTLAEIGQQFGVTRERIRQIQNRALSLLVRRARRPGTPGNMLARLLDLPHSGELDEESVERIAAIAAAEFNAPGRTSIPIMLGAAGVSALEARNAASLAAKIAKRRRDAEQANIREESSRRRADRTVSRWIEHAMWPDVAPQSVEPEIFHALRLTEPGEAAGSFYSNKLGREVLYESGLERDALAALEASSEIEWYQEQPISITYVWRGRERRYYPDIIAALRDGRRLLIEVKPLMSMPVTLNRVKAEAGRKYASFRGWGWVSVDGRRTENDLVTYPIPDASFRAIESELAAWGRLTWPQILRLRSDTSVNGRDVAAFVVQTGAELSLEPHYRIYPTMDVGD